MIELPLERIVDANAAAVQTLGRSLAGRMVHELPEPWNGVVDSARDSKLLEAEGRYYRCSSLDMPGDGRRHALVELHDVTDLETVRKALERPQGVTRAAAMPLTDARDQLLEAIKLEAVGRLACGAAHEFNNLLTVILSYAQLLRPRLQQDAEAAGALAEIARAGNRAAALVDRLLAFARRRAQRPRAIDINALLERLRPAWQALTGERIQVSMTLSPRLYLAQADPDQLEQALTELVINARDAMPQGGTLRICTRNLEDERSYIRVTVRDTGYGMTDYVRQRAFDPFFTTKKTGKGNGLGLAMVYGIVQQGAGHIEVSSEAGKGTRFEILLPVASLAEEAAAQA